MEFTEFPQWLIDLGYTLFDFLEGLIPLIILGSEG